MTERRSYRPRNPLALGSFVLVALVAMALFVPTFSAHVAVLNTVSIDATPTDYALSEDGEDLLVTIQVRNPTRSAFTANYGLLFGKVDGEQLTGLGVDVTETTIPSGETMTVTARIDVEEGSREEIADAIESGQLRITGRLKGTIQDEEVKIEVLEEDDG